MKTKHFLFGSWFHLMLNSCKGCTCSLIHSCTRFRSQQRRWSRTLQQICI
ncbi:hypothetical protein Hanom_Chr11g01015341 [Helianthus anomalus]